MEEKKNVLCRRGGEKRTVVHFMKAKVGEETKEGEREREREKQLELTYAWYYSNSRIGFVLTSFSFGGLQIRVTNAQCSM